MFKQIYHSISHNFYLKILFVERTHLLCTMIRCFMRIRHSIVVHDLLAIEIKNLFLKQTNILNLYFSGK